MQLRMLQSVVVLVLALPLAAGEPTADELAAWKKEMLRLNREGSELSGANKHAEALKRNEEALELCRKIFEPTKYPNGHEELANCINNVGLELYFLGSVDKAVPYFEQALAMKRKLYAGDHKSVAAGLYNLGSILDQIGKHDKAVEMLEESLAMRRKLYPESDYPKGHEELHASISNLGAVYFEMGRFDKALPLYEQSLAMATKLFPEAHPSRIQAINNLAVVHNQMGAYDLALPYFEQLLEVVRKRFPASRFPQGHDTIALYLNNVGSVLESMGQHEQALDHHNEALAMNRALLAASASPRRRAAIAQNLGHCSIALSRLSRFDEALKSAEEALDIRRKLAEETALPIAQEDLSTSLSNIATLNAEMGNYDRAVRLGEESLAVCEKLYKTERFPYGHPRLARSISNLGALYHEVGDNDKALKLQERALDYYRKLFPAERHPNGHPDLALCLSSLGLTQLSLGARETALQLLSEALTMSQRLYPESTYPNGHPVLATRHHNLALAFDALGVPDQAQIHNEATLAITRKLYPASRFPKGHPNLARALSEAGRGWHRGGDNQKALPVLRDALAMCRDAYPVSTFPDGHPTLASALNDLFGTLRDLGNYDEALTIQEEAVAVCRRLYPEARYPSGHEDLARSIGNLAALQLDMGKKQEAAKRFREALAIFQKLVDRDIALIPEAQTSTLARPMRATLNGCLTTATTPGDDYRLVWNIKALATRLLEQRHVAARLASAGLDARHQRLLEVRRSIDSTLQNARLPAEERDKVIATLADERNRLERELAEGLPRLAQWRQRDDLAPDALLSLLTPGTAFIDFVSYMHHEQDPSKKGVAGQRRVERYTAFVLTHDGKIERVDLGERRPIDAAIAEWRRAIDARRDSPAPALLRQRIWEPIAKQLPDTITTLYLAPDGDLARLPWCALPGAKAGTVLLEEKTGGIAVVPHGPFLLEMLKFPKHYPDGPESILALAGVAYDPPGMPPKPDGYSFLRGTLVELESVRARAGTRPIVALSGSEPTVSRLLAELPKARYAHLATHGFFAADRLAADRKRQEQLVQNWDADAEKQRLIAGGSSLAYTGLVLAGANSPTTKDAGIVTGLSLIDLPLDHLQLCVLSACETGLGELTDGEGVQGLQRAFHLAGCPNVAASLWNVNDAATAALMAKFYHELWVNKKPPIEALREAQLTVYRRPDLIADLAGERGAPKLKEAVAVKSGAIERLKAGKTADTKLWAAFLLSGVGR